MSTFCKVKLWLNAYISGETSDIELYLFLRYVW